MALQGEGAVVEDALKVGIGAEGRIGLDVVHNEHIVQADLHLLGADQDVHAEPLVVLHVLFADVAYGVERAGLFALAGEGVGHLHLEARLGKAGLLIRGVDVDAGVGVGAGHDLGAEFKILEVGVVLGAHIKQVRAGAVDLDRAVDDREGFLMLAGLPAVERFAVEERNPAIVAVAVGESMGGRGRGQEQGKKIAA